MIARLLGYVTNLGPFGPQPVRFRSRWYACFAAFLNGNRSGKSLAASAGICGSHPRASIWSMASKPKPTVSAKETAHGAVD